MSTDDLDETTRQVLESAGRLLHSRDEEYPLSHAEIAGDAGLEPAVVLQALKSLANTHLLVHPMQDWARADVQGIVEGDRTVEGGRND